MVRYCNRTEIETLASGPEVWNQVGGGCMWFDGDHHPMLQRFVSLALQCDAAQLLNRLTRLVIPVGLEDQIGRA
jgi:hypothetical protein